MCYDSGAIVALVIDGSSLPVDGGEVTEGDTVCFFSLAKIDSNLLMPS